MAGTEHRQRGTDLSHLTNGQSLRDRGERVDRPGSYDEDDVSPRPSLQGLLGPVGQVFRQPIGKVELQPPVFVWSVEGESQETLVLEKGGDIRSPGNHLGRDRPVREPRAGMLDPDQGLLFVRRIVRKSKNRLRQSCRLPDAICTAVSKKRCHDSDSQAMVQPFLQRCVVAAKLYDTVALGEGPPSTAIQCPSGSERIALGEQQDVQGIVP